MKKCIDYINEALEKDAFQEASNVSRIDKCFSSLENSLDYLQHYILKDSKTLREIQGEDENLGDELKKLEKILNIVVPRLENVVDTLSSM